MVGSRAELARAARPRIFEEILRLMRMGGSHRSMWLMWEIGAMAILMPELSAFLDDDEATDGGSIRFFKKMGLLDKKTREDGALDDIVLMTALFYDVLEEAAAGMRDLMGAVNEFLDPVIDRIAMPQAHRRRDPADHVHGPAHHGRQDRALRAHRAVLARARRRRARPRLARPEHRPRSRLCVARPCLPSAAA